MDSKAKLLSLGAVAITGLIASKGVELAWKLATGKQPPSAESDDPIMKAVIFAAFSAAAVTVVQAFASKKTNQFIEAKGL